MPGSTYRPLAALHGAVTREPKHHHDRFWHRLADFGAHADDEIVRLWELVKREESRLDADAALLWRRLEDIGAAGDREIRDLWQHITD
jgi:hypothetical protein